MNVAGSLSLTGLLTVPCHAFVELADIGIASAAQHYTYIIFNKHEGVDVVDL